MTVKLNKYNARNIETGAKARCHYSGPQNSIDGNTITIYAKDYNNDMLNVFGDESQNNSDGMIDYFEKSLVRIHRGHYLWDRALELSTGEVS